MGELFAATALLGESLIAAAVSLALAVAAGIGVLSLASKLLGVEEMGQLVRRFLERRSAEGS